MIKLQIIGHLGSDCTTNEVNGRTVINFPVAHSEKYKDSQGNQVEKTTWVKCAYWTERPAIAQYLKKGQLVYAEGNPEAEGYLNKENQNAASLKMNVFRIQLLGSKNESGGASNSMGNPSGNYQTSSPSKTSPAIEEMDEPADDLPF
ncbi:single-stranded DNA-binding protein [Hanamia caeni]|jgi:single-strand DNA-binding protein|uniref:Single-stranded DNA-binding protein n=1 Tax=Hanamia caeni TaxID=2294116 RepID=A0A3M9NPS5_9BACT|nr:single-stranded DNA-binding protein [Hanamia caeni]RNI39802.1 single-stranded DNA-binding protein [Hanamia caeni]